MLLEQLSHTESKTLGTYLGLDYVGYALATL